MAYSDEFIKHLEELAHIYIEECLNHKKEMISNRDTYYTWLNSDNKLKTDTIKKIDDLFKGLAIDIVGNEGKGIFYAKNRLGMHDRQQLETKNVEKFDFE
jgi:hypothetical protein